MGELVGVRGRDVSFVGESKLFGRNLFFFGGEQERPSDFSSPEAATTHPLAPQFGAGP